ncbi:uncharacterized protein UV8b_05559 [Ustilaginoidea virens]|uniref:Uncharacterized protein n=1 Tax=Ustilaginoidea virens TaxID=1159556 RepID=A0A8E5MIS2_USTVR|nr:uncharacterized protein UV8b_05559 [Ustilaginoidea virens]QUC21316.1 hypothetical protein UV8b_05559 [Ustilaginoidea virens]
MPSHHRRLIHRHAERILSQIPRDLAPGEARFYSFYSPSLIGGVHTVSVSQDISAPPEPYNPDRSRRTTKLDELSQSFIVVAPKFTLPPNAVDSVFPGPGTSAEHTVLPHIVLKDPHLPWMRSPTHIPAGEDDNNTRSQTTWLALLIFSVEELQIPPETIQSVLRQVPPDVKREQSETFALRMRAQDTAKLQDVVNTTGFSAQLNARDATEPTEVILLPGQLFSSLFVDPGTDKTKLNTAGYKYMAHVRQVATDGMAQAGSETDEAMFSVVVSRRTGPIDAEHSSMMIAHLVSLDWDGGDGKESQVRLPIPNDARVAMTSLYSWTYTCLPSLNQSSPLDLLTNLGEHLTVLRAGEVAAPSSQNHDLANANDDEALSAMIAKRQADGYALARCRTVTGEVTASIIRGPLVPNQVARPLREKFVMQSNFGSDLAIFDQDFGLLDQTYSTAWQLGKTLAMADDAFCAALARLRAGGHERGLERAKQEVHVLMGQDGYLRRQKAADGMVDLVRGLNALNTRLHAHGRAATAVVENRWSGDESAKAAMMSEIDLLSQNSPHLASRLGAHTDEAVLGFAMAEAGEDGNEVLYNEYNVATNPDYAYVYSWVLDKAHLANIPAHYLLPDRAFLPQETLRFFYVDANWTDALIDGALSLANHWGATPDKDSPRTAIKKAINERLRTPDDALGGWHVPMPRFGFLMRSQLLVQFPDLAVDVKFSATRTRPVSSEGVGVSPPANTPARQPILVQKRIAPDTMYCLFDAEPPDLRRITFTMPPHQQCFTVGQTLNKSTLSVIFKKLYTTDQRPPDHQPGQNLGRVDFPNDGKTPVFDWQSRTLDPAAFSTYLVARLGRNRESEFSDTMPTSAVSGLQLNNPILQLDVGDVSAQTSGSASPVFQLSTPTADAPAAPPVRARTPLRVASSATRHPGRQRPASPPRDAELLARHRREHPQAALRAPPGFGADTFDRPRYSVGVYAVSSRDRRFIPSDSPVPYVDLVVSIRWFGERPQSYLLPLTRMLVGIPYGDMPPDVDKNPNAKIPLLARTADPPVPAMLRNQRLNVLKRWGSKDEKELKGHVVFELVPRTQPGVQLSMIRDASFRLPRAQITSYAGTRPRFAQVKLFYEFLEMRGKPKVADFSDRAEVQIRAGVDG